VLSGELAQETETFDHFFTPDRIAHLDRVAESVRAGGRIYTPEELNANLAARRADWIRKNTFHTAQDWQARVAEG